MIKTRQITLTAIFVALGILFPMIFHAMGIGSIFLPMFWPLAIGAFFLSMEYAILMGLATPVLSMMLTGMPPVPILYFMMAELMTMAAVISYLSRNYRWGIFWTLLAGLLVSRLVLFLGYISLGAILGLPKQMTGLVFTAKGLPGVLLMLGLLPPLLSRFRHHPIFIRGN